MWVGRGGSGECRRVRQCIMRVPTVVQLQGRDRGVGPPIRTSRTRTAVCSQVHTCRIAPRCASCIRAGSSALRRQVVRVMGILLPGRLLGLRGELPLLRCLKHWREEPRLRSWRQRRFDHRHR